MSFSWLNLWEDSVNICIVSVNVGISGFYELFDELTLLIRIFIEFAIPHLKCHKLPLNFYLHSFLLKLINHFFKQKLYSETKFKHYNYIKI